MTRVRPRVARLVASAAPLGYVALLFLAVLLVLSTARVLLAWQFSERVESVPGWMELFAVGLRMDVVTASFLSLPPALALAVLSHGGMRRSSFVLAAYFALALTAVVVMEAITFDFVAEYDQRPNQVFVEYLGGSKEVAGTLWIEYRWQLLAVVGAAVAALTGGWRVGRLASDGGGPIGWRGRAVAAGSVALFALGARGTLDHRPVNPSTAAFSGDHLLNQLALNSLYSAAYAAYSLGKERSPAEIYGRMDEREILERVAGYTDIAPADRVEGDIPFLHVQRSGARPARPRNLVIVLEESLGAEFVGCLGGLPLTPNFDELSREGLLLTQLYSTGTRTVRGIEATACGFLPTPGNAVVKLPRAQKDFFTMAALLREHGYATDFVYGGQSQFDNMAAFLLGNGFERAYDESDYPDPAFHGTWGVSDEDLMRKAHSVFLEHGDEPFFALVLSTSNHSPFEYPQGRIEPYDPEPATRENAMKYADYAIGELFRQAKTGGYYDDTVWIVVADHDTRVYGDDLIPVSKFHIPGLILGPGVEPGRFDAIASQIDLLPTALHLLGIDATHPMIGRNLLEWPANDPGRAVLQYYDHHGLLVGDRLVLHPGEGAARCFRYVEGRLVPDELDRELVRDGLAHALLPGLLYKRGAYRLPAER